MMTFWMGVLCGLWVGGPIGFVIAAMLMAAKLTDKDMGVE